MLDRDGSVGSGSAREQVERGGDLVGFGGVGSSVDLKGADGYEGGVGHVARLVWVEDFEKVGEFGGVAGRDSLGSVGGRMKGS